MFGKQGQTPIAPDVGERREAKMNAMPMQSIPTPELDEKGYLIQTETWTPDVATALARDEVPGGLTEDHWKVLRQMRQYYIEIGIIPPIRILSRRTGFTLREMQKMFPNGLANSACKIAGIPSDAIKPSFLYP